MCKQWVLTTNGMRNINITILIEVGFFIHRLCLSQSWAVWLICGHAYGYGQSPESCLNPDGRACGKTLLPKMRHAGFVTFLGKFATIHTPESCYYVNTQSLTARCRHPC